MAHFLDTILVRRSQLQDTPAMDALFREAFDPEAPRDSCEECLFEEHFQAHLRVFPEGQFVAIDTRTNELVGFSVSMRKHFDPQNPSLERWWRTIGEGWLTSHEPDGDWLYAVEMVVKESFRGQGVGRLLMEARWQLVQRLNLRGIIAGSVPFDYGRVADHMSISEYVAAVQSGACMDRNLTKHLRMGFQVVQIIPQYVTDAGPRGYGVLILRRSPDFREVPHE
jgi:GNAT superfamily N-acetyltransferase